MYIYRISNILIYIFYSKEAIKLCGLACKTKKSPDKFVRKFLQKVEPILESFVMKYHNKDFTHLNQFDSLQEKIKRYFN